MSKLELDEDLVRKLSELLNEMGLTEIEYEFGEHRIRIARGGTTHAAAVPHAAPAPGGGFGVTSPDSPGLETGDRDDRRLSLRRR